MTTVSELAEAIRDRLSEIDVERDKLSALLSLYTSGVSEAAKKPAAVQNGSTGQGQFERRSGGPTERLIETVRGNPGLSYGQVIDAASEGLDTRAKHPRRTLGSILGNLVKRGKIRKENRGYYPVPELPELGIVP
jgi:hypothetical protein